MGKRLGQEQSTVVKCRRYAEDIFGTELGFFLLVLDLKVEVSAEPVVEGGLLNVTGGDQLNERNGRVGMLY